MFFPQSVFCRIFSMFSSRYFSISDTTLRYLIHLEYIFVWDDRYKSIFILPHPVSPSPFVEDVAFPLVCIFLHLCLTSHDCYYLNSYLHFLFCCTDIHVFCRYHAILMTIALQLKRKLMKKISVQRSHVASAEQQHCSRDYLEEHNLRFSQWLVQSPC